MDDSWLQRPGAIDEHNDFRGHVYGLISWVGETSPHRRDKLLAMAQRVDWLS
ncbi:hypothetical protein [Nocardia alba]|uniref:hypothetical protein n=1 Tax=Nocardia alba TaxID=225051 RepID=UPI000AC3EC95|nr:hypothetical protein [Nocardia alba]